MSFCSTSSRASGSALLSLGRPSRRWPALRARRKAGGKARRRERPRDRPALPWMSISTPSPAQVCAFSLRHSLSPLRPRAPCETMLSSALRLPLFWAAALQVLRIQSYKKKTTFPLPVPEVSELTPGPWGVGQPPPHYTDLHGRSL